MLPSFLKHLASYDRFLANGAAVAIDFYAQLEKDVLWQWQEKYLHYFLELTHAITQHTVLAHYDDSKSLTVSSYASTYGVGAVLKHIDADGNEAPIVFTPRKLGKAKKNYRWIMRDWRFFSSSVVLTVMLWHVTSQ